MAPRPCGSRCRAGLLAVVGPIMLALLVGCGASTSTDTGSPSPARTSSTAPVSPSVSPDDSPRGVVGSTDGAGGQVVTVTNVVDGDTIDTTIGRIRFIGIDTPERGECNFGPATSVVETLVARSGNTMVLTPAGDQGETDRYGRLLRYVDTPTGVDVGEVLVASGLARARYDSRDGYGVHPRESTYVALDASAPDVPCGQGEDVARSAVLGLQ